MKDKFYRAFFTSIIKEVENETGQSILSSSAKDHNPTYSELCLIGSTCRELNKFSYARWCFDRAFECTPKELINHSMDNTMETFIDETTGEEFFNFQINMDNLAHLQSYALSGKANSYIAEGNSKGITETSLNEYIGFMNQAIAICDSAINIYEENEEAFFNKKAALSNIEYAKKQFQDLPY